MKLRLRAVPVGLAVLALMVTAACGQTPDTPPTPATPAGPANPLQGVWSLTAVDPGDGSAVIDPSQPGLYIFAEGHYSGVYAPGAEARVPSPTPFQPTPEEMVAQYESIIVNIGTYEISGSMVTFRPLLAKSPGFVGGQATAEFQITGDALTLTFQSIVSADGVSVPALGGAMTLRRIE